MFLAKNSDVVADEHERELDMGDPDPPTSAASPPTSSSGLPTPAVDPPTSSAGPSKFPDGTSRYAFQ